MNNPSGKNNKMRNNKKKKASQIFLSFFHSFIFSVIKLFNEQQCVYWFDLSLMKVQKPWVTAMSSYALHQ
jgi:hypothetical protein